MSSPSEPRAMRVEYVGARRYDGPVGPGAADPAAMPYVVRKARPVRMEAQPDDPFGRHHRRTASVGGAGAFHDLQSLPTSWQDRTYVMDASYRPQRLPTIVDEREHDGKGEEDGKEEKAPAKRATSAPTDGVTGSLGTEERSFRVMVAAALIRDALAARSNNHRFEAAQLRVYWFLRGEFFDWVRMLLTLAHLALAMFEPPAEPGWELAYPTTHLIELGILVVYSFDLCGIYYGCGGPRMAHRKWRRSMRLALLLLFYADVLQALARGEDATRYSRVLRPFYTMSVSPTLAKAMILVGVSLFRSLKMVFLLVLHLFLFSLVGFVLMFDVSPFFSSLGESHITLLIALTTSNFPDCAIPALQSSRWYMLFFVFYLVVGTIYLMSLVLATLSQVYAERVEADVNFSVAKVKSGIHRAFNVLTAPPGTSFGDLTPARFDKDGRRVRDKAPPAARPAAKRPSGSKKGAATEMAPAPPAPPALHRSTTAAEVDLEPLQAERTHSDDVAASQRKAAAEAAREHAAAAAAAAAGGRSKEAAHRAITFWDWQHLVRVLRPDWPSDVYVACWFALDRDRDDALRRSEFFSVCRFLGARRIEVNIKDDGLADDADGVDESRSASRDRLAGAGAGAGDDDEARRRLVVGRAARRSCVWAKPVRHALRRVLTFRPAWPACMGGRRWRVPLAEAVVDTVVLINAAFIVVYVQRDVDGRDSPDYVVTVNDAFVGIYTVEIAAKLFAFGPRAFWARYTNRVDLVLTVFSLAAELTLRNSPTNVASLLRLVRLARLARLYRPFAVIVAVFRETLSNFALIGLGGMLLCIFYVFAIVGMELLAGKMTPARVPFTTEYGASDYYLLNFDSIGDSVMSLFVLLMLNNWHILMDAGVDAYGSASIRVFYVSFYFFAVVLLVNLLVAVLLDSFFFQYQKRRRLDAGEQRAARLMEKELQESAPHANENVEVSVQTRRNVLMEQYADGNHNGVMDQVQFQD